LRVKSLKCDQLFLTGFCDPGHLEVPISRFVGCTRPRAQCRPTYARTPAEPTSCISFRLGFLYPLDYLVIFRRKLPKTTTGVLTEFKISQTKLSTVSSRSNRPSVTSIPTISTSQRQESTHGPVTKPLNHVAPPKPRNQVRPLEKEQDHVSHGKKGPGKKPAAWGFGFPVCTYNIPLLFIDWSLKITKFSESSNYLIHSM